MIRNIGYSLMVLLIVIFSSCKKEVKEKEEIVVSGCNCFIETAKDTYHYPIRPRSEEWKAFTSSEQMVEATQISYDILDTMSTMGLIETCFENPLFVDLYLVDFRQTFYDYYSSAFNVCQVLKNRTDATEKLIERYSLMCPDCGTDNNYSNLGGKGGTVTFSFDAIELFLAQKDFLEKATQSERYKLADLVMDKYLQKKNIDNLSLYHLISSVWVAARLMEHDSYTEMIELIKNSEEVALFIKTGTIMTKINSTITTNDIISMLMEVFKNYRSNK